MAEWWNNLTPQQWDRITTTILGESNRSPQGMVDIASVIGNRVNSNKFPSDINKVLTPSQFNALAKKGSLPGAVGGTDPFNQQQRQRARELAERTFSGQLTPTAPGATHYYSPEGMKALVKRGKAQSLVPSWAKSMTNLGSAEGHSFFRSGAPAQAQDTGGVNVGEGIGGLIARAKINMQPGMSVDKLDNGRIRMKMSGGGLGGLDNLQPMLAKMMGGPTQMPGSHHPGVGDAGGRKFAGAMMQPHGAAGPPAGATVLANAGPQSIVPDMPSPGANDIGGLFQAIGQSFGGDDSSQETAKAAQQQHAQDQQQRAQWAYANGFGRGLL
jgi:hypothetical protein